MKRLISALLVAAAAVGMASWADAQYAQPHLVTIPLASQHHNSTFPNGKDSLSFWVETGTKPVIAAGYDSTAATDTLTSIDLSDNWGSFKALTQGVGTPTADSLWLGRLTLTVDYVAGRITAATTDTIVVYTDVSMDGVNFICNNVGFGKTPVAITNGNRESIITFSRSLYGELLTTSFTGVPITQTKCSCFGARAIRFRLGMPWDLAKVKIKSATWTYASDKPQPGQGAK